MKSLNIFDATGNPVSGWSSTNQLNEDNISRLKDQAAKSGNALNAVPSPFSRLHIFETAFKLVSRDFREKQERSSTVYLELVSDCLDALELVFNAKYHQSQGNELLFEQWQPRDLNIYAESGEGQKIFSRTLKLFLEKDFGSPDYSLCLIKYKDMVIAGTSPYSLLFTAPNFDKESGKFKNQYIEESFDLINPSTGMTYFKKYRPFANRSDQFKAYLLSFFEANPQMKRTAAPLWIYLVEQNIQRVEMGTVPQTTVLTCTNGSPFAVSNVPLKANSDEGAADIFNDHIIKLNFKIHKQYFHTPRFVVDPEDRKFDYLIPLKENFLRTLPLEDVAKQITYELIGKETIKVTYTGVRNASVKSKTYTLSGSDKQDGRIIDVEDVLGSYFTIGIFPFLKVVNSEKKPLDQYNDYYKIMLAVDALSGGDNHFKTADFSLEFYKSIDGELELISDDGGAYNAKRFERRQFESPDMMASIYYQVNGTCFDLIKLKLPAISGTGRLNGIIIPNWKLRTLGSSIFTYSVDFGTTNTFIAYTDDPEMTSTPIPFAISTDDMQMIMLQQPELARGGQSVTASFAGGNTNTITASLINHEFVPAVLLSTDRDSPFRMPFRTAVFQKKDARLFELFNDVNIHFAYQKAILDSTSSMYQDIIPNIKWEITRKHDLASKKRVENYIKELCYLFRFKTLLNGGDPEKVRVSWFIPQSLSYAAINSYKSIWAETVERTLGSRVTTRMIFESEAPYYFLKRKAVIDDPSAVLSLDIGGGSTDAMLFVNDIARIGTSFNFAGNVLWSNGYTQLVADARENGFYNKMKGQMEEKIKKDLQLQQNNLYFSKRSTDEIINFWISNNDKLDVVSELENPEFLIIYLVHYCAIIYHVLQMLKLNDYPPPTCIIFSGNGSKYIDFLGDQHVLSRIAGFIMEKVYEERVNKPQIILPAENRKEATCFGGVFKNDEATFNSQSFLGTELNYPELETIVKYVDVEEKLSAIKTSVNKNILNLFSIIKELNDHMPFKAFLNIDANIDAIYNMLESRLPNYFDKGYNNRKEKIEFTEKVSDSLFFYPLVGVIFELGRMNENSLNEFVPRIIRYAAQPAGENTFAANALEEKSKPSSIYKISISTANPNDAVYEIIESPSTFQRAFVGFPEIIKPVCNVQEVEAAEGKVNIVQLNKGKLRRDGENWIVTERLKLDFN